MKKKHEDKIRKEIPLFSDELFYFDDKRDQLRIEYIGKGKFWPTYHLYTPFGQLPFAVGMIIDNSCFKYELIDENLGHFIQFDS